eukprot:3851031-Prymnesium_polylepis.1
MSVMVTVPSLTACHWHCQGQRPAPPRAEPAPVRCAVSPAMPRAQLSYVYIVDWYEIFQSVDGGVASQHDGAHCSMVHAACCRARLLVLPHRAVHMRHVGRAAND